MKEYLPLAECIFSMERQSVFACQKAGKLFSPNTMKEMLSLCFVALAMTAQHDQRMKPSSIAWADE